MVAPVVVVANEGSDGRAPCIFAGGRLDMYQPIDTLPETKREEETMPARLCPYCQVVSNFSRNAPLGASKMAQEGEGNQEISLDTCQNCNVASYFRASEGSGDKVFDQYPKTVERAPTELPDGIEKAFNEALVCYGALAPNGALLMCRRALQETMADKNAKKGDLPTQLDDLVTKGEITPKLREWADQARIGGRIAAHGAGGEAWGDPDKLWGTIDDARAVIDYLKIFFDYVYVLEERMISKFGEPNVPASQSETDSSAP